MRFLAAEGPDVSTATGMRRLLVDELFFFPLKGRKILFDCFNHQEKVQNNHVFAPI
jgi:hypothetical protein